VASVSAVDVTAFFFGEAPRYGIVEGVSGRLCAGKRTG
jgi:hypothetical protein